MGDLVTFQGMSARRKDKVCYFYDRELLLSVSRAVTYPCTLCPLFCPGDPGAPSIVLRSCATLTTSLCGSCILCCALAGLLGHSTCLRQLKLSQQLAWHRRLEGLLCHCEPFSRLAHGMHKSTTGLQAMLETCIMDTITQ